jgi:predicted metal-binding membrane protein
MIAALRARTRLPNPLIFVVIAAAWGLALLAEGTGHGRQFHHDSLIEGGLNPWAALGLFLVSWQAMIAAMMLPSSLPMIRLFRRISTDQPHRGTARASFLAGYFAVWTLFGLIALAGDMVIHRLVHASPWLDAHTWLIAAGVLIGAGIFQFTPLKDACLKACRNPGAYLLAHYRRGIGEGFSLGRDHGLFCLGCCWALMLVSFAAGVANLAWMAVMTLIMVFEKTGPRGDRGVIPIGAALIALGCLVLVDPAWLPPLVALR